MTAEPSLSDSHNDRGREEERAKTEPDELLRRAEVRAEEEVRGFMRELRNQSLKGAAFQAGKEGAKVIWRLLTEN